MVKLLVHKIVADYFSTVLTLINLPLLVIVLAILLLDNKFPILSNVNVATLFNINSSVIPLRIKTSFIITSLNKLDKYLLTSSSPNCVAYGNEPIDIYSLYKVSKSLLSLVVINSLNDNGNIFISIYLPANNVDNSEDNSFALEPVIYKSIFLFKYKLSATF